VQEDDRRPAAGFLEIKPDIIFGDGIGHWRFLTERPAAKIAVNAAGRNAGRGSGAGVDLVG
jgi:hypothetical protein